MDEKRSVTIKEPNNLPPGAIQDRNLSQDTASKNNSALITKFERQKAGASEAVGDNENQAKKIPFPKAVFFIVGNEFCERFTYYGMRTTLVLFFKNSLGYSDDTATAIFHVFVMLLYLLCLLGAIISDSWLAKFKTILYLSIIYSFGSVITAIGAIPYFKGASEILVLVGLATIALGSGGIKPCVSSFGGDQFKLPEQAKQLAWYFSMFYFSINLGALISTTVTPILRDEVHCFGEDECQSLAFGLPALLMIISLVIFLIGRPFYIIVPPSGNILVLVFKTICTALRTKCKESKTNPRAHWLDYADKKYDQQLISDIKAVGRILIIFSPLPLFWALFDQQSSRWVLQANRMDGDIGLWRLQPDHMQIINPLFILAFLPLCHLAIYPALKFVGIKRPLQKMILGGMLAAVAFILSGVLELFLEKTYPVLPENGKAQLRIFNGESCDYAFITNIPGKESFDIEAFDYFEYKNVVVKNGKFELDYQIQAKSKGCSEFDAGTYVLKDKTAHSLFMASNNPDTKLTWYEDYVEKPQKNKPLARTLTNVQDGGKVIWKTAKKGIIEHVEEVNSNTLTEFTYGRYNIFIDETNVHEMYLNVGGVYTVVISGSSKNGYSVKDFVVTNPNSLCMLWIIPQYIVITLAEVMLSVTALEFSYAQAPLTMKSIVTACYMLTIAFGSAIVAIIAELKLFDSMAKEFFMFAGLMVVDMMVLIVLAYFYKPNNPEKSVQ